MLRAGNAGSHTAADHITVLEVALAQLSGYRAGRRHGRKVVIRVDGAGCTHDVLTWLERQQLSSSVGCTLPKNTPDLLALLWFPLGRGGFFYVASWSGAAVFW